MAQRVAPSTRAAARVGNYTADVDTAGMDPEMKATMTSDKEDNPVQKFFRSFGKKKPVVKPTPVPAKPAPRMMSDAEEEAQYQASKKARIK